MNVELSKALGKAYGVIKNPTKNAKNPFLKNKYADLGAVIDATKQALMQVGIFVVQECSEQAGNVLDVTTRFIHAQTGQQMSVNVSVHLKELSPQGSMGAFTYGRRYGLLAAFNLAAEDDDGNEATGIDIESADVKTEAKKPNLGFLKGK